jgi:hypothetical protein
MNVKGILLLGSIPKNSEKKQIEEYFKGCKRKQPESSLPKL